MIEREFWITQKAKGAKVTRKVKTVKQKFFIKDTYVENNCFSTRAINKGTGISISTNQSSNTKHKKLGFMMFLFLMLIFDIDSVQIRLFLLIAYAIKNKRKTLSQAK